MFELDNPVKITERRVLDGPLIATSWFGNMMNTRLIQVCLPVRKFKILVSSSEREFGVLEHDVGLSTREEQTIAHLKGMRWRLISQGKVMYHLDRCSDPSQIVLMNIIEWNCCGAFSPNFGSAVTDLVRDHSSAMMIITKTGVGGDRAKAITNRLPFDGAIPIDTIGYVGGIWLLWNSDAVEVTHLSSTKQEIHAFAKVSSSNLS